MPIKESYLYPYILSRRAKLSPKARERSSQLGRKVNWNYPYTQEVRYRRLLKTAFALYVTLPMLEEAEKWYFQRLRQDSEVGLHIDVVVESSETSASSVLLEIAGTITRIGLAAFSTSIFLTRVAGSIAKQSKRQWSKFVRQATGVDVTIFETEAERKIVAEWAADNVERLRDYATLHAKKINKVIADGIADDSSWKEISEKIIAHNTRLTTVQANYVARDSVGTLSSRLQQSMSEEAGIEAYDWHTKSDKKVRGNPRGLYPKSKYSHYKMDGVWRRWKDGKISKDGGKTWRRVSGREEPKHAGRADNCRCTGSPIFLSLVQAADKELLSR